MAHSYVWVLSVFHYVMRDVRIFHVLLASRAASELGVSRHLGMAKTGFACKPLQKTALHGLSTDWSFDECIANVNSPDTSNVKVATKHANVIHYDYNFATDGDLNKGAVSFYDVAYATSVLQKTNQATEDWKRDGF